LSWDAYHEAGDLIKQVEAYKELHGESANLKEMHDQMLSFGSPDAKHVKQMMGLADYFIIQ
jgi:hypothetical protein